MFELFQHLWPLNDENFTWIFENYGTAIYYILFLIIFIETGLVVMPFLPGDSLLFVAGLFARKGLLDLSFLLTLLYIAAALGDNTNYFLGRNIGLRVLKLRIKNRRLVKQEYLDKTHAFYEKYGPKAIILARFVPIVRTFAPFVAGIAEMKYRTFFLYDLLGGFIWIFTLTLSGYFLGKFDIIKNHIDAVCLIIVFISVVPILLGLLKRKFAKQSS
jgi:membrane-associated protein